MKKPRTNAQVLTVARNGPCRSDVHLHVWINRFCGIDVPREAVCPNHSAPFEYIRRAYFEPTRDLIVWAPRGGAKTRLAAVATLLDLLHKPGIAVRILGGSLEQSLKIWEHLLPDLEAAAGDLLTAPALNGRKVSLSNSSTAAVLTQSQRAVRGLRVQKVRCDEVELFDPQVWEAAQLATRTRVLGGQKISGSIEAISTFHKPYGLMNHIVKSAGNAPEGRKPVMIQWCLLEVLERCPPERDCNTCRLWDDCQGVAKTRCNGFFSIDDAIVMKHRVSTEMWNSEMLCRRPSAQGCVFPSFDPQVHVLPWTGSADAAAVQLAMDFGFHAPFVCLWIVKNSDDSVHVIDEYVQPGRTLEEHLGHIETRPWPRAKVVACDPAGRSRNDQTAESNIALLRRRGYTVRSRASAIVDGLERIRCALKPAAGSPRLFIDPRCTGLIESMRCYHYAAGGSELPVKDGTYDHAIDALRYFFANKDGGGKVVVRKY